MKNLILTIPVMILILMLTGCTEQKEADIVLFTERLNNSDSFCINQDEYKITAENGKFRYSYMPDSNTLLCIYTDKSGVVVQCSLTVLNTDSNFKKRCTSIADSLMLSGSENTQKAVGIAIKNGSAISGIYKLTFIDSRIGYTFLINLSDNEINTNENPTLKKSINSGEITRPTAGSENTE